MAVYEIINKYGIYEEVSHEQWLKIIGTEDNWLFAHKVYTGKMSLDDVPESHRADVAKVVEARLEFSGEYRLPMNQVIEEIMDTLNNTGG